MDRDEVEGFVRAWLAVLLLLPLAGCAEPEPSAEPAGPASVRLDRAFVQYAQDDRPDETFTLSLHPETAWTSAFERLPAIVADLAAAPEDLTLLESAGLALQEGATAIGLDACGAPLWEWHQSAKGGWPEFYGGRFGRTPDWRAAVLSLHRSDLPLLDSAGRQALEERDAPTGAAPPESLQRAFTHGDFVLHVAAERGFWLATWTDKEESGPLLGVDDWSDAMRLHWRGDDPFPDRVIVDKVAWRRVDQRNEGGPMPACQPPKAAETFGWGPWGPEQDFPLPISMKAMVEHVLSNPLLVVVQQYRLQHPDAYLSEVLTLPPTQTNESVMGNWQLEFGHPGAQAGPLVFCRAYDGGPERPDVFACLDTGTWSSTEALPTVDWGSLRVNDFNRPFGFMELYGPEQDVFALFQFKQPLPNETAPFIVMSVDHRLFGEETKALTWEPKRPDPLIVAGFTFEEFLQPSQRS